MKKFLAPILIGSLLSSSVCTHAYDIATLSTYPEAAANHLFSTDGVKDIAAAYGVMMLVTLIHELGHATVAKLFCGAPFFDVVIGGERRQDSRLKVAGIEFAGFNPLQSSARWEEHYERDKSIYNPTLGQDTAMLLAGPLAQATTGYCLYQYLPNNFPIAKITAIGGIIDTIIGINGIHGAINVPWSDAAKIMANIRQYLNQGRALPS